jgi:hypothetical protein
MYEDLEKRHAKALARIEKLNADRREKANREREFTGVY